MAEITGQTPKKCATIVGTALAEDPETQYAKLKNGVSTEQFRALADLKMPYITCNSHPARAYPDGAVAGNLVGFMGTDGEALEGLEQSQNDCLAATNGERIYERGKDGVVIPGTETETPATDGGTLELTINRDLQWYLQQLIAEQTQNMAAQHGSILVYEVKTGKVRAAAEYPTVDPNDVDATDARRPHQPDPSRHVRARVDVQGPDRGDRHRRGRAVAAIPPSWRQARELPQRRARARLLPAPGIHLHADRRADRLVERRNLEVQREGRQRRPATTTSSASASARARRPATRTRRTA